jgi:hypothetical protein
VLGATAKADLRLEPSRSVDGASFVRGAAVCLRSLRLGRDPQLLCSAGEVAKWCLFSDAAHLAKESLTCSNLVADRD